MSFPNSNVRKKAPPDWFTYLLESI